MLPALRGRAGSAGGGGAAGNSYRPPGGQGRAGFKGKKGAACGFQAAGGAVSLSDGAARGRRQNHGPGLR